MKYLQARNNSSVSALINACRELHNIANQICFGNQLVRVMGIPHPRKKYHRETKLARSILRFCGGGFPLFGMLFVKNRRLFLVLFYSITTLIQVFEIKIFIYVMGKMAGNCWREKQIHFNPARIVVRCTQTCTCSVISLCSFLCHAASTSHLHGMIPSAC